MKKIFLITILSVLIIPTGISQNLPSYVPVDGLVAFTHSMEMLMMKVEMETMVQ